MKRLFNSLRGRMLLVATLAASVVLGVMAWHLPALFERHVLRQQRAEMEWIFQQLILGLARDEKGRLTVRLADPRFARPLGGHYWQVFDDRGKVLLRSRSLWDEVLKLPRMPKDERSLFLADMPGPGGRPLLALVQWVELDAGDGMRPYVVLVARERRLADAAVAAFRGDVWRGLAVLGLFLVLALLAVVASGLEPVERLRRQVMAIERGERRRLSEEVVEELRPLAHSINALLDKLEADMEKARRRAAELAHGLKTPVAVMASHVREAEEAGLNELAGRMMRQLERLQAVVQRELTRVRMKTGEGRREWMMPASALFSLRQAMLPLMESRGIDCRLHVPEAVAGAEVAMSRGDFLELVGNVMENACKWARARVDVRLELMPEGNLRIVVEDDGPGLAAEARQRVFDPGVRLDEQREGQGLGLSIVRDIAEGHGLDIAMEKGRLGGLRVAVTFPAERVRKGQKA